MKTDAQKQQALLDIIERWIPYVETFWSPSDVAEPETDFYFDKDLTDGVEQPRASGAVAAAFATLLIANPTRSTFGPTDVPRSTLLSHVEQTIRHELATHDPTPRPPRRNYALTSGELPADVTFPLAWPRDRTQMATDVAGWAWAAHLLWDDLRADTKSKATAIVEHEVAWLMAREPDTMGHYDTHADDNSWNTTLLTVAAAMLLTHPDVEAWVEKAKSYAINASTIAADRSSSMPVDGIPLSAWATTANLKDDLTVVHHGIFHPTYSMGVYMMCGDSAVHLARAGRSVPEALRFRLAEVWDAVIGPLATADGDVLHPASTDWTAHDMQHISYLSQVATVLGRADASALESVAIERVAARQAATTARIDVGGRCTEVKGASLYGMADFAYEAENIRSFAMAWWTHELFGPSPTPTETDVRTARAAFTGVHAFPDAKATAHVTDTSLNVISWWESNARTSATADFSVAAGQIVPWSRGWEGDEVFTRAIPSGIWGQTPGTPQASSLERRDDFFSSAAITSDGTNHRYLSITSFSDGAVLLLDRGAGTGPVDGTFRFGFEHIPGMTGERPVYTAESVWTYDDGPATPAGHWANVADRFGLIVAGGGGLELTPRMEGDPGVGVSPYIQLTGSRETGSGNRGAIVLPLASHEQTAQLARFLSQPSVSDEHWSALIARAGDGTARIAIARWGGAETATLGDMTSPLGAPIPNRPEDVRVDGATGSMTVTLDSPASTGWHGYFWAATTSPVTIRPISETQITITNGPASATVTIRYVDVDGTMHAAEATLPPDAVAHAHAVEDRVAIVTPALNNPRGT